MGKKRLAAEKSGNARKKPRPEKKNERQQGRRGAFQSSVPLPDHNSDDENVNLSEDDFDFVQEYSKELGFLNRMDRGELDADILDKQVRDAKSKSKPKPQTKPGKGAGDEDEGGDASDEAGGESDSDLEELALYEKKPRTRKEPVGAKEEAQLPVKTPDGDIVFQKDQKLKEERATELARRVEGITVEEEDDNLEVEQGSDLVEEEEDEEEEENEENDEREMSDDDDEGGGEDGELNPQNYQNLEVWREELKGQMALSSNKLIQNPEENAPELKTLLAFVKSEDMQISRLGMVSLMAVFKDIVPGYRIRLPTEKEKEARVSKEVARLQAYEAFLLRSYQIFLKQLLAISKQKKGSASTVNKNVAVRCMGGLLSTLHHFNYSSDLLRAIVPFMASGDKSVQSICCESVGKAIEADVEGHLTLEAVQLIADLVKRKKCGCQSEVVDVLMDLSFPDLRIAGEDDDFKKDKKKKKKKAGRKRDDVEKSFAASKSGPDVDEKAKVQSQSVEALFEIFFRVLKHCIKVAKEMGAGKQGFVDSAELQKKCPLLFVSLKGLSKYASHLSVEYFQDLLEVFGQLLGCTSLPFSERLRCLLTASDILRGQGEALNIDRKDFYKQLYWTLKHWRPDVVLSDVELDSDAKNDDVEVDDNGDTKLDEDLHALLVWVSNQMLCESKLSDYSGLAAFIKRLLCLGVHLNSAVVMGIEAIVNRLLLRRQRLRSLLDGEAAPAGGKEYNPVVDDPAEASALSATLWELVLVAQHYHPHVAEGSKQLMKIPLEVGSSSVDHVGGVLSATGGPLGLVGQYSTAKAAFCPVPKAPKKQSGKGGKPLFNVPYTGNFENLVKSEKSESVSDNGVENGEEVEEEALSKVLQDHHRNCKQFQENGMLRHKNSLLCIKLREFMAHLEGKGRKIS